MENDKNEIIGKKIEKLLDSTPLLLVLLLIYFIGLHLLGVVGYIEFAYYWKFVVPIFILLWIGSEVRLKKEQEKKS